MAANKIKTPVSGLRILICNDDGIQSQGLKSLERVAKILSPDVWIVAPEREQSGRGNALTLTEPLRIQEISPRRFSATGTPADCVILAVNHILSNKKPDLILSGINHGSNVSDSSVMSGTIGAANTGAQHSIKSIAISQDCDRGSVPKLSAPEYFLPGVIKKLISFDWPEHVFMNVNFPDALPGAIKKTEILPHGFVGLDWEVIERLDPNSTPYYWLSSHWRPINKNNIDSDIMTDSSIISVTPMISTVTAGEFMDKLKKTFSNVHYEQ
ncbi:MAG: 5'/3'-nucleotidase SurE [Holosporales bacterium]|jgi:5'-nucleotidase|nr:5'/3'-nucleotidase SurE [Holosporales bacterium]